MKKKQEHVAELKNASVTDLEKRLVALREEVREKSFKASQNQLKGVRDLRAQKREIARIMTLVAQKRSTTNK